MSDTRHTTIGGEICQNCNRRYQVCWHASDKLWKQVTGQNEGILCPDCFDRIAGAKGISIAFEVIQHPVYNK